ncbi:BnaA10g07010D [Brassica napus]|uniref:BnaA10g07010D protein n=1 Tax=Brassica napus TaxID=3708 RepID=A0A078FN76_BRANA|nr:BnaA10g07010D [Brassica napus]
MMYVRTLYLQYAKLKEDYGLAKQAMKVYEEATKKVPECQRSTNSFHSAREHMQKKDEMEDVEEVKWCKKTGVCEPVTGNVEGTELPEECDDELLEKTKYRSLMKKSMMLWLEDLQERERKTVKKALKMVAKPLDALKRTNRHKLAQ